MAQTRENLQKELEKILGSNEVYFQPPPNIKMNYPAIVYSLDVVATRSADDQHYYMKPRYAVTFITKSPDSQIKFKILEAFPMSSLDRSARLNNLYHHYYTLYY